MVPILLDLLSQISNLGKDRLTVQQIEWYYYYIKTMRYTIVWPFLPNPFATPPSLVSFTVLQVWVRT